MRSFWWYPLIISFGITCSTVLLALTWLEFGTQYKNSRYGSGTWIMKQIKCISVGNLRCTVLLSFVLLVWMALFLLCCIENSNCYKVHRLLTSTVSLSSLAFGFLNKNKTISSGLWKQQWAASFQQQHVCELDGISLALLWNHLNLSFPYLRTILLHLLKKKIHELVFCALKWTRSSFEIWQHSEANYI